MQKPTWIVCLLSPLTGVLAAQCPPGALVPTDLGTTTTVADKSPAWSRWQSGKEALAARDFATARQHLQAALEFHPAALPLLFDLLLACADDPDLQQLWAERYARAAADAQGRFDLDATERRALAAVPGLPPALELARKTTLLRAAAIADLARLIERNKPQGQKNAARVVLVHWAAELLLRLGRDMPRALLAAGPAVNKVQAAFATDLDVVLQGLQRVLQQRGAKAGEATEVTAARALRAARLLVGLQQQGQFRNLQGPPPRDLGRIAEAAERVLADAAAARAKAAKVWTVAELAAMSPAEAAQFTATHADPSQPAIADSTGGHYRIETCCGHGTLLEVARTIELHHQRLATHFDSDPFAAQQGHVYIVPEHHDLETEGAPHWWAGGFQQGDRTVVRFAWSDGPTLGHALVHELTHRFDGVLRPFLGAWYGEGHAQWTAGHYGKTTDTDFVDDYLDIGPPAHSFYKGYADREAFTKLLQGTIEEYRDNYFAGYSLYAFLRSFPPKAPKFRDALARYEKTARAGQKDPVGWFTQCFCDGKQGRPASLDAFLVEWTAFLRGCYDWLDEKRDDNRWIADYGSLGAPEHGPLVMDPPTWSWARQRAEPWFGQDHAAAATLLLQEVADAPATAAAGIWSLTVDGWRADTLAATLSALQTQGPPEAAAAFAVLAQSRFPALPADAPGERLADVSKSTRALLAALAARTATLQDTAPKAAAATAAEHAQLAQWLGQPALPDQKAPPPTPPTHLAGEGLAETSLTDYDDARQAGLWYATPEGDLHVGRQRPRDTTGTLDREAHRRDAFVHGTTWLQPGDYVVRGRVHFTTSYVAGAIVFGHQRRDRDLRLHFDAGDERYAIGKQDTDQSGGRLSLRLEGLWERDGQLPETRPFRALDLPAGQTWFDFVLHIDGPRVRIDIDGEPALSYATHDGAPIEGQVGFAMSTGAVRIQAPMVQRRDGREPVTGLDLAQPCTANLDDLLLLPVRGVPLDANGTIVLWLPPAADAESRPTDYLPRVLPRFPDLLHDAFDHPQAWVLAVPHDLSADERKAAQEAVLAVRPTPMPLVEHRVGAPFDGRFPWLLFVDQNGLLRAAVVATDPQVNTKVARWSRMLRPR